MIFDAGFATNHPVKESQNCRKKNKSKYLAFIDSDDIWAKNKLKTQVNYMEKNNQVFSHTSYQIINEENKLISSRKAKSTIKFDGLLSSCDIGLSTVMLKKKIISNPEIILDEINKVDNRRIDSLVVKKISKIN